jgi:MFS family permease
MTTNIERQPSERKHIWRIIGWGGAVALILTPLVAMQFTSEVNWDETDFIFAAIIFGIVGGLIELAVRISSNWYFRFGAIFAVLAGFMVVWSNLAVGMIGNEDNPVNLWFGAVLLIAILGAILSRLHKRAIAAAMFAAGTAQAAIGLFAGILGTDMRGGIFTIILATAWIISGALFSMSCRKNT